MCSDALKHIEALLRSKIAKSIICHLTLVTVIITIIKVKCNLIRKTYKITIVKGPDRANLQSIDIKTYFRLPTDQSIHP